MESGGYKLGIWEDRMLMRAKGDGIRWWSWEAWKGGGQEYGGRNDMGLRMSIVLSVCVVLVCIGKWFR